MNIENAYNQRTVLMLGEDAVERLMRAHVLVVGAGGVGSYAIEALGRAGIGRLTIIDADAVAESNVNRQLPALHSTVGIAKVEVMRNRLLDINPQCQVKAIEAFLTAEDAATTLADLRPDFVIDAIDSVAPKVALIEACLRQKIKLISSMGAGGRLDPTQIRYADISETFHDGLARAVRQRLKKAGITKGVKVVFSTEQPRRSALTLTNEIANKVSSFGTVSWLPSIFGLYLAAYAVNSLSRT